jgi:hypothetical protein
MVQKLMIVGMGDLAWWTLEILLRTPGFSEYVEVLTCDNNEESGLRRTNSALLSSSQTHPVGKVRFQAINVFDLEGTAEAISAYKPDVIFDATSLQSWWVITNLTKEKYELIDRARYGPWIPMHCALTYNIMRAIKMTGLSIKVVNCGFPDVTNCALDKLGLAPHVGIGNIDNVVAPVRMLISEKEKVPFESVKAYMLMPHFISYYVARFYSTGGAPFILKLYIDGDDISEKYAPAELLCEAVKRFRRLGGTNAHSVVGASCAKNLLHVLKDSRTLTHSPGPSGLPGGYPVRIGKEKVEVALPPGVSLDEAVQVNQEANKFDGIEEIRDDGTIVITDESYIIMKNLIGYDCKEMKVEDAADHSKELRTKFESWAEKP